MEEKNPKISVIMPVYNAEKYLDESVLSILNQTFTDFEFIIVNDCSTDNSLKIIKEYAKKDKRIKVINSKKNFGAAKSRNKGLKIANGKYIAIFDAGDISLKNRLELQYIFMERNKEIFLCGFSAIAIDEKGKKLGIFKKFNNPKKIKNKLLKGNPIVHSSVIFRNTNSYFYREKFESTEDYDLYLRILSKGKKITNMPDFLIKYRINQDSISFQKRFVQELFSEKIKKFYYERKKRGEDAYENFDATEILNKRDNRDSFQNLLQARIIIGFQAGYMKQVRKDIKTLMKKQGLSKNLFMYYVLSWIPTKLIWFIKRKIS